MKSTAVVILSLINTFARSMESHVMFGPYKISPSSLFYESEHCYGLVNLKPIVPGHVLLIPKRIVSRCADMSTIEATDLFQSVHKVGPILEKHYKATSLNIAMQDGIDAGQSVPHVHFHILPRKSGDYENNDDIYEDLEKQELNNVFKENREPRTTETMAVEANLLRTLFPDNIPNIS